MKRNQRNKTGQLFELDVVLAIIILVAGFFFLKSLYVVDTETTQTLTHATDLATTLEVLQVNQLSPTLQATLQTNAVVFNETNSIAKQLVLHLLHGEQTLADQLLEEVVITFLPSDTKASVKVLSNNEVLEVPSEISSARRIANSRKFMSGFQVDQPLQGYSGSLLVSSPVHQLSAYAYMGGFVGQGTIALRLHLPDDAIPLGIYFEGDVHDDVNIFVNNNMCAAIAITEYNTFIPIVTSNDLTATCLSYIKSGENELRLDFQGTNMSTQFVGGGFFKVDYETETYEPEETSSVTYYLPAIDGIFNVYDAIPVPGVINEITANITYFADHSESDAKVFFSLGDTMLFYDNTSLDEQTIILDEAAFDYLYDIPETQQQLLPLRMGFQNLSDEVFTPVLLDVALITDLSGSMSWSLAGDHDDSWERMNGAIAADTAFINMVLDANENHQISPIGYASSIREFIPLINNRDELLQEIASYTPDGSTCIACGIAQAIETLDGSVDNIPAIVLMSDGEATASYSGPLESVCAESLGDAGQAICLAEHAFNEYGIQVYAVAFGTDGLNTMNQIAFAAGTSEAYQANDVEEFIAAFEEIATQLINQATYTVQVVNDADLFADAYLSGASHVTVTYKTSILPTPIGEVFVSGSYPLFEDDICTESIHFPAPLTPIAASVLSYSGGYWTDQLSVNDHQVFDLRDWSEKFESLGDPFVIPIPSNYINRDMDITLSVREGSSSDTVQCSNKDSLQFIASVQSVFSSSRVYPYASGCTWTVIVNGETKEIAVPHDYIGLDECVFEMQPTVHWNQSNLLHQLAFDFFSAYDLNNDYVLDVDPTDFGLETDTSITSDIPYMWGPAILEVSVWE